MCISSVEAQNRDKQKIDFLVFPIRFWRTRNSCAYERHSPPDNI
jgi:hypothetical protein